MKAHDVVELVPQNSEEDFRAILPGFLSIWNHEENLKYLSLTSLPFTAELTTYWFKNHLNMGGRYFAVIDENRSVLGLSVIKISPVETFELFGLGVKPECKNMGIGSALVRHAVDSASDLGYGAIDTGVFADNYRMLRLMLSFEFMPVRFNYHARSDGTDMLYMKKML